jgi:hypothetical protein
MIDSTCPNCQHRVTFSYLRLFILPKVGPPVRPSGPVAILPITHCDYCGHKVTMATWWMFVMFLAGIGVGYLVYKGVGSADSSANFFGGMVGFLLWQVVANALYIALGGRLQLHD